MTWTAPLNKHGHPCRVCRQGRLCRSHRAPGKAGGPRTKLTRNVLDAISTIVPTAEGHEPLWTAAGVHPGTWFRWLDQGADDAENNRLTEERELHELVRNHRRSLAHRLAGTAVQAATGVYRTVEDPKTGKLIRVYQEPPDGRLAASLAGRLDRSALPPEKSVLEHEGEVRTPTRVVLGFDPSLFPAPKGDARLS